MSAVVASIVLFGVVLCTHNRNAAIAEGSKNAVAQSDPTFATITIGPKSFVTGTSTSIGTPVVPMWTVPIFAPGKHEDAGWPTVTGAQHATVWTPQRLEDGTYNHYAALCHVGGRLFAMWGNHPHAEDAAGQRVLFSCSDQWGEWTPPQELFPAPGPVLPHGTDGIHLKPDRWAAVDGTLYAIAYVHGAGVYPIARRVTRDGALVDPFLLFPLPDDAKLPQFMKDLPRPTEVPPEAKAIIDWYRDHNQIPWWASSRWGVRRRGIDGAQLIESFSYRARDGVQVLMMRNWGTPSHPVHNNRVYASFKSQGQDWGAPHPTDIPDSPSRSEAVTLENGTVLLVGSQIAHTLDEALYLDRVPLTVSMSSDGYTFERSLALRAKPPARARFPEVRGRNTGFAYPSSIVLDDSLYTLYSVNKEDMAITRVPLESLGLK